MRPPFELADYSATSSILLRGADVKSWYADLSLRAKLLVSFGVILLLTVAVGVVSIIELANVRSGASSVAGARLIVIALLAVTVAVGVASVLFLAASIRRS